MVDLFIFDDVVGIPHCDGALAAGGDVKLTNFLLNSLVKADVGLVAGGDVSLTQSGTVYGDIYYGGTGSIDAAITVIDKIHPNASIIGFEDERKTLTARSLMISSMPANGSVEVLSCWVHLTGTSNSLNIFELPESPQGGLPCGINIKVPTSSAVVVNVPGETPVLGSLTINTNGLSSRNILWNFHEASSVDIAKVLLRGTVLAPHAEVALTNCHVQGSIIAASLYSPDLHGEVSSYPFAYWSKLCGCIPTQAAGACRP